MLAVLFSSFSDALIFMAENLCIAFFLDSQVDGFQVTHLLLATIQPNVAYPPISGLLTPDLGFSYPWFFVFRELASTYF